MRHDPQRIGVIFDMDGLLLDTERVCMECFVSTQRKFSLPEDQSVFIRCVGLNGPKSEEIIAAHLPDSVNLADFLTYWDAAIDGQLSTGVRHRPGAATLIQALFRSGVVMGVATSTTTDRARQHLADAGLLQYLACVVGGDAVSRHKPDPEVYHTVATKIARDISSCFAFEDSDAGTHAAVASGATTCQIPDLAVPSDETRSLGHHIAPNLLSAAAHVGLIEIPNQAKH